MQSLRQLSCASNKNKSHQHNHQNRRSRDDKNSKQQTSASSQRPTATVSSSAVVLSPPTTTTSSSSAPPTNNDSEQPTAGKNHDEQIDNENPASFASSDDTNVVVGIVDSKTGVVTAIGSHHHHHAQHDHKRAPPQPPVRERSASATPRDVAVIQDNAIITSPARAAATTVAAPLASLSELHLLDNSSSGRSSSVPRSRLLAESAAGITATPRRPQQFAAGCFSDSEATTQSHHTVSTTSIPALQRHLHALPNGDIKRPPAGNVDENLSQKESVQTILDQLFRTHTASQQHHQQQHHQQVLHNKPQTTSIAPLPPEAPPSLSPAPTLGSSSQLDELDIVHNILNIPALRSLLKLHDALSSDESSLAAAGRQQQVGAVLLPPPPPPPRAKSSMTTTVTQHQYNLLPSSSVQPQPSPALRNSSSTHLAEEIINSIENVDTSRTADESEQNDFWLDAQQHREDNQTGQILDAITTVTLPLQADALNIAEELCEQVQKTRQQSATRSSFDLDAVESDDDVDLDQPAAATPSSASNLYVRTVPPLRAAANINSEEARPLDTHNDHYEESTAKSNKARTRNSTAVLADMKYMTAHTSSDTASSTTTTTNETGSSTMTDDVMQALGEEDEEEHETEKHMIAQLTADKNMNSRRTAAAHLESSSLTLDTTLQLQTLLQSEHFRALLRAHDTIARRDYGPAALEQNSCMMIVRPVFARKLPSSETQQYSTNSSSSPLPLLPPPPPPPSTLTTFVANKITTFPSAAPYATTIGPQSLSSASSRSNRPVAIESRNTSRQSASKCSGDAMRVSFSNEEIKTPIQFSSAVGPSPLLPPPPPPVLSKQHRHHPHERSGSAGRPMTADSHLPERTGSGVQLLTRSATVTSATATNQRRQHQSVHWQNDPTTFSSSPSEQQQMRRPVTTGSQQHIPKTTDVAYDAASSSTTTTASGTLTTNTDEEDIDDDNTVAMRCVRLVRTNEPLGATIRRDERTGNIMIARVFPGGAAQRSGLMRPGDVLLEVNNMPAQCKGTISFRLIPSAATPTEISAALPFQSQPALAVSRPQYLEQQNIRSSHPNLATSSFPSSSSHQLSSMQQQLPHTITSGYHRNISAGDMVVGVSYDPTMGFSVPAQQQQQSNYTNILPHPSVAQRTRLMAQQKPHHQHQQPQQQRQYSQPLFREVVMHQQRCPGSSRGQPQQPQQQQQATFIYDPTQNSAPLLSQSTAIAGSNYFAGQYQQQHPPVLPLTASSSSLVRLQLPNSRANLSTSSSSIQQQRSARSVEFLPPPRAATIVPAQPRRFMRAHFDFDPELDNLVPNRDEGLPFKRGDILEIVEDFADVNWWRARLIQTSHSCTNIGPTHGAPSTERLNGYVPARQLQERRMLAQRRQQILNGTHYYCKIHGYSTWPHGRRPERRAAQQQPATTAAGVAPPAEGSAGNNNTAAANTFQSVHSDELDRADIITYESVSLLEPGSVGGYGFNVRPIVIIGPPGVGKNELRARLIQMNSERFQTTIPHTSRPMRPNEREGDEYHFVSRADMEQRIKQGNFLEWGEYEGNLYGTSLDEVSKCMRRGTVCVLVIHPSAVRRIRTAEYMPFIIYVQPPSLERLRETRMAARARSTFDERLLRGFTEHEFRYILSYAERMESQYSHVFDAVIVNDNLALAFAQLKSLVYALDREPQWVPTVWLSQRDDIVGNSFLRHQSQQLFPATQSPAAGSSQQQMVHTHRHPQQQAAAVTPQQLTTSAPASST